MTGLLRKQNPDQADLGFHQFLESWQGSVSLPARSGQEHQSVYTEHHEIPKPDKTTVFHGSQVNVQCVCVTILSYVILQVDLKVLTKTLCGALSSLGHTSNP